HPMPRCIKDIGVFASTDPVAIDQACWDAAAKAGKKFKGAEQLQYAEKCGLGSREYTLIEC
ncbi:MAG: 4Fe-4S ferredoxin, partial [Lentisphaeria bacterium]|nr:4Fe-4S ferredoxin [Lentisphaeria bacterium]